ncbi:MULTISPECIES: hypothetical protein [unclassified Streptomyces]|uniref:hypothetical protein n=1 Tax=unclassified Streptomyces TaxID=2593676 RepID=UPI0038201124
MPVAEYLGRSRDDGLPADPWVRAHVRAGGTVERIAHASMTVSNSPAQWRQWTGLPFDRDGAVEVPGALTQVYCDTAHDHAVHSEPNVWIRHAIGPRPAWEGSSATTVRRRPRTRPAR